MNKLIVIISITATSMFLSSCGNNAASNKEAGHETGEEKHEEHENKNTTTLTSEQMKSIKIELGRIEKKQLTASLKANGILKVPNQNKASATALLGGVIKTILVQPGNSVSKGQTIATIANNAFITMQEEFLSVSSKAELSELEFARQKELQTGNAGALKNLQISDADLKTIKARKASLQKQLELAGINTTSLTSENIQSVVKITSPISGAISNVLVNIGSYVDANNPIAEVVDNSQLHLDLYVYEKDLQKLMVGQIIHFTLTNNPGKEYDAEVYAISNTFEVNTKAVAIHAKVEGNKIGLIDGMSITALVSLDNATVDAVPVNAIVNHEGQDYIFVLTDAHTEEEHQEHGKAEEAKHKQDEHGHDHSEKEETAKKNDGHGHTKNKGIEHKEEVETVFEKIPVRKGTTDVGYSEITLLKEVPANAKVVIHGAFFVLAKMNNKGEGHAH